MYIRCRDLEAQAKKRELNLEKHGQEYIRLMLEQKGEAVISFEEFLRYEYDLVLPFLVDNTNFR